MIGVIISREDRASLNIRDKLLEEKNWKKKKSDGEWEKEYLDTNRNFLLIEKEGLHLYYDNIDKEIKNYYNIDLLVFASRHSGESGKLLTVHSTGNWKDAEYGGEPRSLSIPAPRSIKHLLNYFESRSPEDFSFSLEATHHGPTELNVPSLFAELGSKKKEWKRSDAAKTIARGILSLKNRKKPRKIAMGIGGGHYCPKFTRILRSTDISFGHIIPDYCLPISEDIIIEAFKKSNADFLVLDGKAKDYSFSLPVRKESNLKQRSGIKKEKAEKIEKLLDGDINLTKNAEKVKDPTLKKFRATKLAKEAQKIDEKKTEKIIQKYSLGYSEKEGKISDIVINSEEIAEKKLIEELIDILKNKYKEINMKENEVILKTNVFNPKKAQKLGVPEGPKFGKLANGKSIKIDNKKITPEQVHKEKTKKFEI